MRTVALSIVLSVLAVLAAAQQPKIIGFGHDGTLTWTNAQDLYCGIECNWNLAHTWLPVGTEPPLWNSHATQGASSVGVDIEAMWNLITALQTNLVSDFHGFFFRVVASDTALGPRFTTNYVRLTNASTSVLYDVTFGLKQNWAYGLALTNFTAVSQGDTTPSIAVWQEITMTFGSITNQIAPLGFWPTPVQDGWYLSYDHEGSNRVVEAPVIPFGPLEKNILMTVSNRSVTIKAEWINLGGTLDY